jgi:hypothetical protein
MPVDGGSIYGCGMDPAPARPRSSQDRFGAGRLFLTDSRLVFGLLNSSRYALLARMFGVSRAQANVVTFMTVVVAADAAYESIGRVARTRLGASRADVLLGDAALRGAAFAIGGPASRKAPLFPTLVAGAALASVAFPGLRQAAARARAAERRVRQQRIGRYADAMRASQA